MRQNFQNLNQQESLINLQKQELTSIYFGGGTPSLLDKQNIKKLISEIEKNFSITEKTEITLECDPGTFDEVQLIHYKNESKITRISLGVQSFDDQILTRLHRSHNQKQVYQSLDILEKVYGLQNVSLDLLMNLDKNDQVFFNQLQKLKNIQPGHVSIYSLMIEPGSYFYDKQGLRQNKFPLPDLDQDYENMIKTHEIMTQELNYLHYEVSSYCKQISNKSKHNQVYWTGITPFYGFGMGATSLINQKRVKRPTNIKKYYEWVDNNCLQNQYSLEENETNLYEKLKVVLLGTLRNDLGIQFQEMKTIIGEIKTQQIQKFLEKQIWIQDHNIVQTFDSQQLILNNCKGFLVSDQIALEILSFYENLTKE